jgi:hypothetical protein
MTTFAQQRAQIDSEVRTLLGTAKAQGREMLTAAEARRADALLAARKNLDAAESAEREIDRQLAQRTPVSGGVVMDRRAPYDRVARIGQEERTYNAGLDPTGQNFLRDVARGFLFQDPTANERLARHSQEELVERGSGYQQRANVGTSNFSGLVVPQYLTDLYAPATASLRPLADAANRHPLPGQGMTFNISRITTTTSVGIQTEGNAASNTDIDDTLLQVTVQTAAGYSDLTRQAIERGTGIDEVTMGDLTARWATTLDSTIINQATTGLTNVAQATTYTSASPTVTEFWPFIGQASSKLESALLGYGLPDYVVMHSRRWNWMTAGLGSTWPLIGGSSGAVPPQQVGVQVVNNEGPGVRGILSNGMRVIVDNNIATNLGAGTNQDEVYVISSRELHLWEDPQAPLFIRAEQPLAHQLAVRIVIYSYFAYEARRYPNNPGKISGTGLVGPTGF